MTQVRYGFLPEPPNPKHREYETLLKGRLAPYAQTTDVDLRPFSPSKQRHNQLDTSSCVGNSVVRALEVRRNYVAKNTDLVDLSRLAVYYLSRELMVPKWTDRDEGTYISTACDVLRRFGVCAEADWPFDRTKINQPPPWSAMRRAYMNKIQAFYRITSTGTARVAEVARCIQAGLPVVYGTQVGSEWSYYRGDIDRIPPLSIPKNPQGGHATILIGTKNGLFIGENSWGTSWGSDGFYYIEPKVIASSLSADFWVMENANDPWTQGKMNPAVKV